MKPASLLIFFTILSTFCFCQNAEKIAALQKQIAEEKTDTSKVMLLIKLFDEYKEVDSTKAMQAANDAASLGHSIGFKKGESMALINKGVFLNLNGENDEAEKAINQSLQIRKSSGDYAGQGYCLRSLGNIYYDKNDYSAALQYYLSAAPLFQKANDIKGLSGNYIWIGNVFNEGLRQFDKAVQYFTKSLDLARQINDSNLVSYNYNNLGQAYYNAKNYSEALHYYNLSKTIKELRHDNRGVANAYSNISSVYFDLKKYDSALYFNEISLKTRTDLNDKKGMATSFQNGANIFLLTSKYDKALDYYQKAINIGEEIDFKDPVIESYNGLSKYYEAKGDEKSALFFYKKYKALNDSVYNSDISNQINTLETKYQSAKKQELIQEQQFELTKKQYWIYGASALALLIFLLSISYYRRNKLKHEKKMQLALMRQQDMATKAVMEAEENERKRIASDLHDGVGQMMSVAKMNLSAFEEEIDFKDVNQKNSFEKVIGLIDESCKEIRSVSHQMMPNALLKSGLASAIKEFIDQIDSRVLKVSLYTEGLNEKIDTNTETVLYRVVQECVNNVLKHSGANHLDISMIKDTDGISVSIEDNGKGFDTSIKQNFEGIGLKNITSRITYLKGTIEFDSTPGKGTLVAIHIPAPQ
ncbi:MAG: sensor histidine kinase [Bacteroidetes bacterium]|nr:sensor histidine kinase [Bacteroidota bacterium]MBS1756212.1 sensor histidine kinase [Bacteroidota bacterium]